MNGETLLIAFFGHDALESTVVKRATAFAEEGCRVTGFMFRRERSGLGSRIACPVVDLGVTEDRSYLKRLPRLAAGLVRTLREHRTLRAADILYARNIDMLAIASLAKIVLRLRAAVIYEVLDIQRPFLRRDGVGIVFRFAERAMLRGTALLVVSAPDFIDRYFAPIQGRRSDWLLVENKLPKLAAVPPPHAADKPEGPPWVIGWFGTLRCRDSLQTLCRLADTLGDAVLIRLGGRPSPRDLSVAEIERAVGPRGNMDYIGAYTSPGDIRAIYSPVHFSWCIDRTDAGTNSDWLLPNRLYEGGLHGAVALARRDTATGRRVESLALGVAFGEPLAEEILRFFARLDRGDHAKLSAAVRCHPDHSFVDRRDTAGLVAAFRRLSPARPCRDQTCRPEPGGHVPMTPIVADPHSGASKDAARSTSAVQPGGSTPLRPDPLRVAVVTVVIPFFQRQPGILARSLRSISRQRLGDQISVEVVVVDDGSPSSPEAEVESGGHGIAVRIVKQVNGGPGAARNTGLDHVPRQADFIAFLDSDDEWRPDHLANAVAALQSDCDLYFCDNQPFEFEHSYFSEISKQTGGAVDVANLRGAHKTDEAGEPYRPGPLSFPSDIALEHMTRFYLAHTSTIVIRRATVGHVRFDGSLRVAGEDYLYIISVASQARRVCYTLGIQVDRGRGVNLYMGSVGWGHPGNLNLILDNLGCFTKARRLRLDIGARKGIKYRIRSYRTELLYAWLRSAVFERRLDLPILWRAFRIDAGLLIFGPYLVAAAAFRKLSGGRAVDHYNVVQPSATRELSL